MKKKLIGILAFLTLVGGSIWGANSPKGQSFATLREKRVQSLWYGTHQLPSPTFLLTGTVPKGATTLQVQWKGEQQSGNFTIDTTDWAEFSLHFRWGYHNIDAGKNTYKLTFFSGNTLRGIGFLTLNTQFQEKIVGDSMLYIDEAYEKQAVEQNADSAINEATENKATDTMTLFPAHDQSPPLLAKYGANFVVISGVISYNEREGTLYEGRNPQQNSETGLFYGELYRNGQLLAKNVPVAFFNSKGENSIKFSYSQPAILDILRGEKQDCGFTSSLQSISLTTQQPYLEVSIVQNFSGTNDTKEPNEPNEQNGTTLIYQNKKLEIFPVITTNGATTTYSLKYRYALREKDKRNIRKEDFIVKNQSLLTIAISLCETPPFSYYFEQKKQQLIIKRAKEIGGKAETYTRHLDKIPSYYRTSP